MTILMQDMNWMQIDEYLKKDDRIVLVTGSMEEHGYNSVGTDTQVAWEIAKAACEKTGVLLAAPVPYAFAGWVDNFSGTVSIRPATYMSLINDILRSFYKQGFKRIFILNGHGQNEIAKYVIEELSTEIPDITVRIRSWYAYPKILEMIREEGGGVYDHASWWENFPWINQPGEMPQVDKLSPNIPDYYTYGPKAMRELTVDGVVGGSFAKPEATMRRFFDIAVQESVDIIEGNWNKEMFPFA
jgi:creatinine amidohydrolase